MRLAHLHVRDPFEAQPQPAGARCTVAAKAADVSTAEIGAYTGAAVTAAGGSIENQNDSRSTEVTESMFRDGSREVHLMLQRRLHHAVLSKSEQSTRTQCHRHIVLRLISVACGARLQ